MSSDFTLIRPITITSGIFTSSTIPEAVAATWSNATTYADGDRAGAAPVDGAAQLVYESLQGGNLNHALADDGVWWRLVGSVYPAYSAGATYALNDIVSDLTNHLLYKSLAGGNIGNALTDATKWVSLGATNRWKMLDARYQTQSTNEDEITVVLTPGQVVTALSILNIDGTTATLTQSTTGHSETINLVSHEVPNWLEYWTESPITTGDAVFLNIPAAPSEMLTVTIENSGTTAKIGVMTIGTVKTIGATNWGATRSINDFSRATEDADGNIELTVGNYTKRMRLDVTIDEGLESEATRILEEYRATPLVFVGSTDYSMLIIYGFLGPWEVPKSRTGRPASIEVRGLT